MLTTTNLTNFDIVYALYFVIKLFDIWEWNVILKEQKDWVLCLSVFDHFNMQDALLKEF